jgi:hypothetical protein
MPVLVGGDGGKPPVKYSGNKVGWIITGSAFGILALLIGLGTLAENLEKAEKEQAREARIDAFRMPFSEDEAQQKAIAAASKVRTSPDYWYYDDVVMVGDSATLMINASPQAFSQIKAGLEPLVGMCSDDVKRTIAPYKLQVYVEERGGKGKLTLPCP